MTPAERTQTARVLRAAAAVLAAPSEVAVLKELKKLASKKKSKALFSPDVLIEALRRTDPAWRLEGKVTLDGLDSENLRYALLRAKTPEFYSTKIDDVGSSAHFAFQPSNRAGVSYEEWKEAVGTAIEKKSKKGLPTQPKEGQIYYEDLEVRPLLRTTSGIFDGWVFQNAKVGIWQWTFLAPGGHTYHVLGGKNAPVDDPAIWGWLYKTVKDLPDRAQATLDGVDVAGIEKEQNTRSRLGLGDRPVTVGAVGTCAVCDKVQKLRNGRMVHHGYLRPGYGSIYGTCAGSKQPPYEVSPEGCYLAAAHYEKVARGIDEAIAHVKQGKGYQVVKLTSPGGSQKPYRVSPTSVAETSESLSRAEMRSLPNLYVGTDPAVAWPAVVTDYVSSRKKEQTQLYSEAKRMKKKAAAWVPTPPLGA